MFGVVCCSWCPDDASPKEVARVLLPLVTEATCEYTADTVTSCLGRILGPIDGHKFSDLLLGHVLTACYYVISTQRDKNRSAQQAASYLQCCGVFMLWSIIQAPVINEVNVISFQRVCTSAGFA